MSKEPSTHQPQSLFRNVLVRLGWRNRGLKTFAYGFGGRRGALFALVVVASTLLGKTESGVAASDALVEVLIRREPPQPPRYTALVLVDSLTLRTASYQDSAGTLLRRALERIRLGLPAVVVLDLAPPEGRFPWLDALSDGPPVVFGLREVDGQLSTGKSWLRFASAHLPHAATGVVRTLAIADQTGALALPGEAARLFCYGVSSNSPKLLNRPDSCLRLAVSSNASYFRRYEWPTHRTLETFASEAADVAQFRDMIVVIGAAPDAGLDNHATSFGVQSGALIHASAIETLLDSRALPTRVPLRGEIVVKVVLGVLLLASHFFFPHSLFAGFLSLCVAGVVAATAQFTLDHIGWVFPYATTILGFWIEALFLEDEVHGPKEHAQPQAE